MLLLLVLVLLLVVVNMNAFVSCLVIAHGIRAHKRTRTTSRDKEHDDSIVYHVWLLLGLNALPFLLLAPAAAVAPSQSGH